MKLTRLVAIVLMLFSFTASAQASTREAYIQRIEHSYSKAIAFSSDSAFIDSVLRSAKSANPSVGNEILQNLKPEFVSALNSAQNANGGLFGGLLSTALAELSEEQVEHLALLLEDPVLLKFQAAVAGPSIQKQIQQRTSGLVLMYGVAINKVLSAHGLKEVH